MNDVLLLPKIDWEALSGIVVAGSIVGGFFVWLGRAAMRSSFVSHGDHASLHRRIEVLEKTLDRVATKDEVAAMEHRLGPVETGVAVLSAQVQSVKETTQRTEHMVTMLYEHQLNREKKA